MAKFIFSGRATIQHLNIRKEGDKNSKVLAIDVKVSSRVPALDVLPFLDLELFAFLFIQDNVRAVRNALIEPIHFSTRFGSCDVTVNDRLYPHAEVKKFVVAPVDGGRVDLTFSMTMARPTSAQIAFLAEHVAVSVGLDVRTPPELELKGGGKK